MSLLPRKGRLIGIDYGTVRIGIAISDISQSIASPHDIYRPSHPEKDSAYFRRLIEQERAVGFVVGLPVHLDGRESQISVKAEEFANWLHEITQLPVHLFDERFSSAFAEEIVREAGLTRAKRKQLLDKLAAQILLTSYLESSRDESQRAAEDLTD